MEFSRVFTLTFLKANQYPSWGNVLFYLIWYSYGRFFIEGMLTDSLMLFDVIRMAQLMSLVLILGSVIILIIRRRKGYASKEYQDS